MWNDQAIAWTTPGTMQRTDDADIISDAAAALLDELVLGDDGDDAGSQPSTATDSSSEEDEDLMDEIDEVYAAAVAATPPTHVVFLRSVDFGAFQDGIMETFELLQKANYDEEEDGSDPSTGSVVLIYPFGAEGRRSVEATHCTRVRFAVPTTTERTADPVVPTTEPAYAFHLKIILCLDHAEYARLPNPEQVRTLCRALAAEDVLTSVEIHCPQLAHVEKRCRAFHLDFGETTHRQQGGEAHRTLAQINEHLERVAAMYLPLFRAPVLLRQMSQ